MKINKSQLKQIIKEELGSLTEAPAENESLLKIGQMAKAKYPDKFNLMVQGDAAAYELGEIIWGDDAFYDLRRKSGVGLEEILDTIIRLTHDGKI